MRNAMTWVAAVSTAVASGAVCLLGLVACTTTDSDRGAEPTEIGVEAKPVDPESWAVRLEFGQDNVCSGTIVAQGYILTARHCIASDLDYIKVDGVERRILNVALPQNETGDQVLVGLDVRPPEGAKFGSFPRKGDRGRFWGNVDGFDKLYREGYMTGWEEGKQLWTMNCGQGDSGSGIFNDKGEVIGVLTRVYKGRFATFCVAEHVGVYLGVNADAQP